tara:strand:- start:499 stop:1050 length:552 start_codon:yes stop_codon:yes gene_type:complete
MTLNIEKTFINISSLNLAELRLKSDDFKSLTISDKTGIIISHLTVDSAREAGLVISPNLLKAQQIRGIAFFYILLVVIFSTILKKEKIKFDETIIQSYLFQSFKYFNEKEKMTIIERAIGTVKKFFQDTKKNPFAKELAENVMKTTQGYLAANGKNYKLKTGYNTNFEEIFSVIMKSCLDIVN